MVDVVDETVEMVAASVIPEGKAVIDMIGVNATEVYPTTNTVELYEGDDVNVDCRFVNEGSKDTCFMTLTNVTTGTVVDRFAVIVSAGVGVYRTFPTITMPATDLTLKMEVGHVE